MAVFTAPPTSHLHPAPYAPPVPPAPYWSPVPPWHPTSMYLTDPV